MSASELFRPGLSERAGYEDNSQHRRRRHGKWLRSEPARRKLSSVWTDEHGGPARYEPWVSARRREDTGSRPANAERSEAVRHVLSGH